MNAQFNFKLPDDLLDRAKKLAETKGVSLSKLIKDWLEENVEPERTRIEIIEEKLKQLDERITNLEMEKN